ncbi:MAG TPA: hypothetical protein VFE62_13740 [Gemmataceae bacterium]|nr:hypothetical protein [Gemmataceae bacterium]
MTVASASFDIEGGDTACLGCAARSLLIATKRSGAKSSTAIDAWNFICFFDLYDVVVSLATLCRLPGYDSNGATVGGINSHQDFGNSTPAPGMSPRRSTSGLFGSRPKSVSAMQLAVEAAFEAISAVTESVWGFVGPYRRYGERTIAVYRRSCRRQPACWHEGRTWITRAAMAPRPVK